MRTYISVPENHRQEANQALERYGQNVFSVPLSISGQEPATHYGCCWSMTDAEINDVDNALSELSPVFGEDFGVLQIIKTDKA